ERTLAAGEVFVDFLLHGGGVGVIALDHGRVAARARLIEEADLIRLVHALLFELRGAVFTPARERTVGEELKGALADLAGLILWPALAALARDSWPTSLAIVPVGPLTRLPWAALPLPDGRSLCEATELAVMPGLRLSMLAPATGSSGAAAAANEGPPLVIAADAGELEHVAREARAVTARFPAAQLLAGTEASAERFLELAPRAPW